MPQKAPVLGRIIFKIEGIQEIQTNSKGGKYQLILSVNSKQFPNVPLKEILDQSIDKKVSLLEMGD